MVYAKMLIRKPKPKLSATAQCLNSPPSEEYVQTKMARIGRAAKITRLDKLYVRQLGRCVHCSSYMWLIRDRKAPTKVKGAPCVATIEHIIPRSQGGGSGYANTAAACYKCNNERGDRPLTAAELRDIEAIRTRANEMLGLNS